MARSSRLALTALLLAAPSAAEESAQFLKIGVGARGAAMGGAYTAIASDVNALAWNPAGLSSLAKRELGAMHAEMGQDARYDFRGYAAPLRKGVLAVGAFYLSQGAVTGRDGNGRITGSYGASDTALSLAYAATFGSRLKLGAAMKYIKSRLADASAQSVAFDLGAAHQLDHWGPGAPSLGVAIQNLGSGMKFLDRRSPLPLILAAGFGYRLPMGLTLALDYKSRPHAGISELSIGTEYSLLPRFALRAGYASNHAPLSDLPRTNELAGFATGFGIEAYGLSLDYSMTPFEVGNVQRFSLSARF